MISERASQQTFLGTATLLFAGSAALTIAWCGSMATMKTMPMPGGWSMSMTWMQPSGQTWVEAAGSFLAMWLVMMAAMMLPSLVPMLARYRGAIRKTDAMHLNRLTALVGLGYFFVWALFGAAIFPIGVALAGGEMEQAALSRSVPIASGLVVLISGVHQFTRWKAHHLASCREAPGYRQALCADSRTAWQQGLRFGLHCGYSCLNLTAVLLVIGVMDLRAMALVTIAITAERLMPDGQLIARTIGVVVIGTGFFLIARAVIAG